MKKFSIIVSMLILLSACSNQRINELEYKQTEVIQQLEQKETTLAELETELKDEKNNISYTADSPSVLSPEYEASNVNDGDPATSWCYGKIGLADGPFSGTLSLIFEENIGGKQLEILPGFARDEEIYFKNNRIKTLSLSSSASPMQNDAHIFQLEDRYGIHNIEIPEDYNNHIVLAIPQVYPGSQYDDTCIAEIVVK